MATRQNKALVGRVAEAWNKGDASAIDEVFASSYVLHPLWPNLVPFGPQSVSDREQIKYSIHGFREEFPDLRATVDEILEAGNKVITRWTFQGTNKAGKQVSWTSVIISRVARGKVVEDWVLWDRLGYWQQRGIVPETQELMAKAGDPSYSTLPETRPGEMHEPQIQG